MGLLSTKIHSEKLTICVVFCKTRINGAPFLFKPLRLYLILKRAISRMVSYQVSERLQVGEIQDGLNLARSDWCCSVLPSKETATTASRVPNVLATSMELGASLVV